MCETYFEGPCTCEHDREKHSWGSCAEKDSNGDYCSCEAGWVE